MCKCELFLRKVLFQCLNHDESNLTKQQFHHVSSSKSWRIRPFSVQRALGSLSLWFYLCSTCSFHQFPLTKPRTSPDLQDSHLAHVWKRSTEAHFASKRPDRSVEAVTLRQSHWRIVPKLWRHGKPDDSMTPKSWIKENTNCDHCDHEIKEFLFLSPDKSMDEMVPFYCPHSSSGDPRPVPFGQKWTNSDKNKQHAENIYIYIIYAYIYVYVCIYVYIQYCYNIYIYIVLFY